MAAWDEPRSGSEAYRIMDEGLQYLQCIHGSVLKVGGEKPGLDPMQLCQRVLVELGLPQIMANPLVAASFQASLMAGDKQNLLSI